MNSTQVFIDLISDEKAKKMEDLKGKEEEPVTAPVTGRSMTSPSSSH